MQTIILHMLNEDPVVGEVDALPVKSDTLVFLKNPRRRDGRELPYLEHNVTFVAWPLSRLTFVEILPDEEVEENNNLMQE